MAVPRPSGPTLVTRLLGRVHPRRLRRRLPVAIVAAAVVVLVPGLGVRPARTAPPGQAVLVAVNELLPGQALTDDAVRSVIVPTDAVADDALARLPEDAVVRSAIGAGEVVTARRVGTGSGLTGRLEPDRRAVTIPRSEARVPVVVGDLVDLIATTPAGPDGATVTKVVVQGADVLAEADDGLTLSVPSDLAPAVHQAVATGVVDVAITPFRR